MFVCLFGWLNLPQERKKKNNSREEDDFFLTHTHHI